MCVLYVSFGSKVRSKNIGCVAMSSALLCVFYARIFCRVWREQVQVVLSGLSRRLFCFDQAKNLYVGMVVYISWLHSCLGVWK